MKAGAVDRDFVRIGREAFAACPSDSIDYAVMEKLQGASELGIPGVVVPLLAGWSDVGAWDAVWASSPQDADGNSVQGDTMLEDTRNSLVISEGRLVACLGLDDMIIVETPDAVLVARKDKTQDIKKIVNRLKAESRPHADNHRKVHRPWGYYDSIDNGPRFQVKRIVVKPGASLSLQMHHHRAEHWIVVQGTAKVTRGDEIVMLAENQSTYIPLGTVAPAREPRQDRPRDDRGAVRHLSRRGRHRPLRGQLRTLARGDGRPGRLIGRAWRPVPPASASADASARAWPRSA